MNIERLKELKEQLASKKFDFYGRQNIRELIDAAIARQSATSEEVAEAIEKIEKIVAFDNEHGYRVNNHHSMHISDIKTALVALQAYQPWMSVSDRPKKDNKYLAVLQFYKEPKDRIIEVVEYYGEWKVNYEWNVVCYKPLPEPPKGE